MDLKHLEDVIRNSGHIVCLMGVGVSEDCGCMNYRSGDNAYAIETKYGYSPEEIYSTGFYNTRTKDFFTFYHNEVLEKLGEPGPELRTLKKMEDDRKLYAIITREIYGLAQRAGCQNVITLHGSVYNNKCPHCGTFYDIEFMKHARGIPLCTKCGQPVRPRIVLTGEMIDNQLMTAAANEISKADTLLVLGCSMHSLLATSCVKYFEGERIILINDRENYSDNIADLVYHGKPRDILPQVYH